MGITVENINVVVTLDAKQAQENAKKFNQEIDQVKKRLKELKPDSAAYKAEFQKLVSATENFATNANFNEINKRFKSLLQQQRKVTEGSKEWGEITAQLQVYGNRLDTITGKQGRFRNRIQGTIKPVKGLNTESSKTVGIWNRIGKQFTATRVALATFVGVGIGLMKQYGGELIGLYDKQSKAEAAVSSALISTNQNVGRSLADIKKLASDRQGVTLFGDEETLKASSLLLTFKEIREEVFDQSIPVVQDYATALAKAGDTSIDLRAATIQIGKALNDPIKGLAGLAKAGVQFSEDQKQVIKDLVETGRTAEAQKIILAELESQFGGAAEAAAKAGAGGITQLSNILGDVKEAGGELLVNFINPLIPRLQVAAENFGVLVSRASEAPQIIRDNVNVLSGLATIIALINQRTVANTAIQIKNRAATILSSTATKAKAVVMGLVSVATATYSTIIGLLTGKLKIAAVAQRALNFVAALNPWGLVIVAIGTVVTALATFAKNNEKVAATLSGLFAVAIEVFSRIKTLAFDSLKDIGGLLLGIFSFDLDKIKSSLSGLKSNLTDSFKDIGSSLAQAYSSAYNNSLLDNELDKVKPPDNPEDFGAAGAAAGTAFTQNFEETISGVEKIAEETAKSAVAKLKEQLKELETAAEIEQDIEVKRKLLFDAAEIKKQIEDEEKALGRIKFGIELEFLLESDVPQTASGIKQLISQLESAIPKTSNFETQVLINTKIDDLKAKLVEAEAQIKRSAGEVVFETLTVKQPIELDTTTDATALDGIEQGLKDLFAQALDFEVLPVEKQKEIAAQLNQALGEMQKQQTLQSLQNKTDYLAGLKEINENELLTESEKLFRLQELTDEFNRKQEAIRIIEIEKELEHRESLGLIDDNYFTLRNKLLELKGQEYIEGLEGLNEYEKELFALKLDTIGDLADGFGDLFADLIEGTEDSGKKFAKNMILLALDTLEKIVNISIAQATAASFAQVDSITTYGAAGAVRAAVLAGLIKAAFTAVKAVVSTSFEHGGVIGIDQDAHTSEDGQFIFKEMPDTVFAKNGAAVVYTPEGNIIKISPNEISENRGNWIVPNGESGFKTVSRNQTFFQDGGRFEKTTNNTVYRIPHGPKYMDGGRINSVAGIPRVGQRHDAGGIKMFDGKSGKYLGEWERGEPYMILSRKTYAQNREVVNELLYNSMNRQGESVFKTNPRLGSRAPQPTASDAISSQGGKFELGTIFSGPAPAVVEGPAVTSGGGLQDNASVNEMIKLMGEMVKRQDETNKNVKRFPQRIKAEVLLSDIESQRNDLEEAADTGI